MKRNQEYLWIIKILCYFIVYFIFLYFLHSFAGFSIAIFSKCSWETEAKLSWNNSTGWSCYTTNIRSDNTSCNLYGHSWYDTHSEHPPVFSGRRKCFSKLWKIESSNSCSTCNWPLSDSQVWFSSTLLHLFFQNHSG